MRVCASSAPKELGRVPPASCPAPVDLLPRGAACPSRASPTRSRTACILLSLVTFALRDAFEIRPVVRSCIYTRHKEFAFFVTAQFKSRTSFHKLGDKTRPVSLCPVPEPRSRWSSTFHPCLSPRNPWVSAPFLRNVRIVPRRDFLLGGNAAQHTRSPHLQTLHLVLLARTPRVLRVSHGPVFTGFR